MSAIMRIMTHLRELNQERHVPWHVVAVDADESTIVLHIPISAEEARFIDQMREMFAAVES